MNFALATMMAITLPFLGPKGGATIEWHDNYEEALIEAKAEKKKIALFFTGSDWCGWSRKLKKEVLDQPKFTEVFADQFIWVVIDQPMKDQSTSLEDQKNQLVKKYQIEGTPTLLIIDGEGHQLTQTGYRQGGPEAYATHLKKLVDKTS